MKWIISIIVIVLILGGGGFWYWQASQKPSEVSFENTPLVPNILEGAEKAEEKAPIQAPESTPLPAEESKPAPEEALAPETKPTPAPSPAARSLEVTSRLLRFGHRVPVAPRSVDTVVVHSSYNALGGDAYSVDKTISEYEQYGVGAHYLIDRSGTILRLVEEKNIAYHAGSSKMPDGRKNVNDFSIGIELIGTEESGFTDKQYDALEELLADIRTRHTIKHVVGHGDIAPGRKTDPWKFDWKRLKN